MSTKGDVRKLLKKAQRRGWAVTSIYPRHRLQWTDGTGIVMSNTPSCNRAGKNFMADLKRAERSSVDNTDSKPYIGDKYA